MLGLPLALVQLSEALTRGEAVSEEAVQEIFAWWVEPPCAAATPAGRLGYANERSWVEPPWAAATPAGRVGHANERSRPQHLLDMLHVLCHMVTSQPAVDFIRRVLCQLPDKALSGLGRPLAELLRCQRWDPELQQCMLHEIILPQRLELQDAVHFGRLCLLEVQAHPSLVEHIATQLITSCAAESPSLYMSQVVTSYGCSA